MSSTTIQIADAVVAELNDASLSLPFTARRSYLPTYKLEELDELHVTVIAKDVVGEMVDRSRDNETHRIDVGIQKRLSEIANGTIDPLMQVSREIRDHLKRRQLTDFPTAAIIGFEHDPVYVPRHLEEHNQFTSVITLSYLVTR